MIKLVAALCGVVLLISSAVLGAAAVQQPYLDFFQLPGGQLEAQPASAPDCEAPAAPGVNWRGCDKSQLTLHGPQESLAGAILAGASFRDSYLGSVNMSGSAIAGLDLSSSVLFLVNFTGAAGIPTGSSVYLSIYTCPDGSALANYYGDVSAACEWLPDGPGSPPPAATVNGPRPQPQNDAPAITPTAAITATATVGATESISATMTATSTPTTSPVGDSVEESPLPEAPPAETAAPDGEESSPPPESPPTATAAPLSEGQSDLSINGRLLDGQGAGVAGMVLGLSSGATATTDGQGQFSFLHLEPGTYTIFAPPPYDLVYDPPSRRVIIPPKPADQLFVGATPTPQSTP